MNDSRIWPTGFSVASDIQSDRRIVVGARSGEQPFAAGERLRRAATGPPKVCGPKRATGIAAFASTAKPPPSNCSGAVKGGSSCGAKGEGCIGLGDTCNSPAEVDARPA